ncbi:hypothetical protein SpAn4DRAFT_1389 [Sporomusa ovata]|uniref:Uncharacterized protein n=1 Tax=Sporomusa ovata TaxID=2378 RepID=A0A0U1KSL8_9FIRM|nr:hypothetical protein SpAn4DRAFT_1389 [Sporomusa ovata]
MVLILNYRIAWGKKQAHIFQIVVKLVKYSYFYNVNNATGPHMAF